MRWQPTFCGVYTPYHWPTYFLWGLHAIPLAHLLLGWELFCPPGDRTIRWVYNGPIAPQCVLMYTQSHGTSKCFLFETQKCKIAEISNISRSATILPLCTKDLMINAHTYKNTVCIAYVQYMCKRMASDTVQNRVRGANGTYKGIMVFLLKTT